MLPICSEFGKSTNGQQNKWGMLPICKISLTTKKPLPRNYPALDDNSLGAHLKRKRLKRDWTRKKTAIHLGVSEDTYRNWEWNWFEPEISHRKSVIEFLEFDFFK